MAGDLVQDSTTLAPQFRDSQTTHNIIAKIFLLSGHDDSIPISRTLRRFFEKYNTPPILDCEKPHIRIATSSDLWSEKNCRHRHAAQDRRPYSRCGASRRRPAQRVGGELMFTRRWEVDRDPDSGPAIGSCPVSRPRCPGPAKVFSHACTAIDWTMPLLVGIFTAQTLQDDHFTDIGAQ